MDRRRFFKLGFRGSLFAGVGAFGYGSLIERRHPVVERVICRLPERYGALDGLTIAVMSDFHHDEFHDDTLMATAIEATNALKPDVVFLAGDFISRKISGLDALADHFGNLESRLGVYGVLGNHDQWTDSGAVSRRLKKSGVEILRNDHAALHTATGEKFVLAGMESAWGGNPSLDRTLRGVSRKVPAILGWHEPDPFLSIRDDRMALQISGHTHGGQVCMPFFGALKLPSYGKKFVAGLFRNRDASLYVTRGIGAMGVPVRFCCPPEISLIVLQAEGPDTKKII